MDISSIINQQMEPVKSVQNNLQKGYDKDTFLQILVAQMKYQNPLQPESNTEYISQYAIFSQIEQLSNIQNTLNLMRAENIIGKFVNIKETINGQINEISGIQNCNDLAMFIKEESKFRIIRIEIINEHK